MDGDILQAAIDAQAAEDKLAGRDRSFFLLDEMRAATRRSHNIANALILSKLVVVLTDKALYARALSTFLPVYSKLEALLRQHKDVRGLSRVVEVTSTIPARAAAMEQVMPDSSSCCCMWLCLTEAQNTSKLCTHTVVCCRMAYRKSLQKSKTNAKKP
jgi:hypothetical protein